MGFLIYQANSMYALPNNRLTTEILTYSGIRECSLPNLHQPSFES